MPNVLVEIKGPGGLAKVAEKDMKSYLRRDGYSLAESSKPSKKPSAPDVKKGAGKTEPKKKPITAAQPADDPKKTSVDLAEAAKKDAEGFKTLLADVKKATTPQLEMIADEYDLGLALSRLGTVAERRKAVTKALQEKMKKG